MIRFRFTDDERRFVRFHSEMFEKLARAGLREGVGSETLRNVGKIEQMAFMEGIRQGLAMAWIGRQMVEEEDPPIAEPLKLKAFQLHAMIYGSSDTPLRAVEKEWLKRLGLEEDHMAKSWLDDKPMRFAPATLQELEGTTPPIAPMVSVHAPSKPTRVPSPSRACARCGEPRDLEGSTQTFCALCAETDAAFNPAARECPTCGAEPGQPCVNQGPGQGVMEYSVHRARYPKSQLPPPEAMHGAEVTPREPWEKGEYEPDEPDDPAADDAFLRSVREEIIAEDKEVQPESPEFLDIARSEIQTMKSSGWDPKTWQDIILGLHRKMGVDAGYLDIQLTTHFGRTVLDQCGLAGLAPPDMMSFEFLDNPPPGKVPTAPVIVTRDEDGNITDDAPVDDDIEI